MLLIMFVFGINVAQASDPTHNDNNHAKEEKEFNATEMIMHHIKDAHDFHIAGDLSLPLPIILFTDNGLVTFLSSEFHHNDDGHVVVSKNGANFVKVHEKIYQLNAGVSHAEFDAEHHIINGVSPLDFSITKNTFSLMLSAIILLVIFMSVASHYKKGNQVPKGLASFVEPLIVFVRDEIVRPNIDPKKYERFLPYLLTIFFFVWLNNLLGLVPFFPGSANLTGNIAFTMTLAVLTLLVTNLSGTKDYWGHILWMPGVPLPLKPILAVIELVGVLTKPFALMIRLFANISAGHIIILSLFSIIFIFKDAAWAGLSAPLALFMNILELLVAFLQAYVFTMLSALFIGQAVEEHDHH
ncbi:MAG: F0F1 ATP synthase subunit A [Cytophagales bacterium]|nr:F0F1 ATP synthase subunit A [Cytophagales bacterium]